MKIKHTERGWGGHFICANRCRFRRNTLLESDTQQIVVSTVGLMEDYRDKTCTKFETIGFDRYYETMAFFSDPEDHRYHDIDVTREIGFKSPWAIAEIDADDRANDMHEVVVKELTRKMKTGTVTDEDGKP